MQRHEPEFWRPGKKRQGVWTIMRPIQLMIAGAAKAGTTSMKTYLGEHPGICTHRQRGFHFFNHDGEGLEEYAKIFPRYFVHEDANDKVIVAKNVSILYSPDGMRRLKAHNPWVQVVVSLRNPVDRAYSDYWYARRMGWEDLTSFEDAIEAGLDRFGDDSVMRARCAYLDRSRYSNHLCSLLEHFGKENVHVVLLEDMKSDPAKVLGNLFALFDELDPDFVPDVKRRHNPAALPRSWALARMISSGSSLPWLRQVIRWVVPEGARERMRNSIRRLNERDITLPPMNQETWAKLADYFKPYNVELSQLLGRDLSHWDRS